MVKQPRLINCVYVNKEKLLQIVCKNGYEAISKTDKNGKEYILCTKGEETHIVYLAN